MEETKQGTGDKGQVTDNKGQNLEDKVEEDKLEEDKEDQLKKLKEEKDQLYDKYIRLNADFDNFRKRMAKEKFEITRYVTEDILLKFLDIIDNFDRAFLTSINAKDVKTVVDGIELVYKQFNSVLENLGVKKIDAVGKLFDPNFHDAIVYEENKDFKQEHIIEVIQAGYILGDKVIKHPKVKVAK